MKKFRTYRKEQDQELDPVGKADADIDNDGDVDKSDEYLKNRRKKIKKSIKKQDAEDDVKEAAAAKKFSAKEVKMATGIAKQKHDSMTDAVERIEKIAKGLSDHPGVARALKRYNEEVEISELKKSTYAKYLSKAGRSATAQTSLAKSAEDDEDRATAKMNKHSKNIVGNIPDDEKDPEEFKKAKRQRKIAGKMKDDWKRGARNRVKGIARAGRLLSKEEFAQLEDHLETLDTEELIEMINVWTDENIYDHLEEALNIDIKKKGKKSDDDSSCDDYVQDPSKKRKMALVGSASEETEMSEEDKVEEGHTPELEQEVEETYNSKLQSAAVSFMQKTWESAAEANKKRTANAHPGDDKERNLTGSDKDLKDDGDKNTEVDDTEERGHDDVSKAGKATSKSKMRPGDNEQGDKKPVKQGS